MRPIVSFIDSHSYFIAEYISETIKPIANVAPQGPASTVQLFQDLNNLMNPEDLFMVSIDVKNMFMSITQELAEVCASETTSGNNEHWTENLKFM